MFVDGPSVVIGGREAALLEQLFDLDEYRARCRGNDAGLDRALNDLHRAAVAFRSGAATSGSTSASAGGAEVGAVSDLSEVTPVGRTSFLSASDVAVLADCSARAVRLAATENRLNGSRRHGEWCFDQSDVDEWLAQRRTTKAA